MRRIPVHDPLDAARATLADRLHRQGLARVADAILAIAQPCILLTTERTDESALAVGASKLGGIPDLPPSLPWPEWNGGPLSFVAQLRACEAVPSAGDHILR